MNADVLIVGAGLAGLAAAGSLQAAGLEVVVLEAGDRPGGRLATHTVGPGRADSGAQFFTTRSPEFAQQVAGWQAREWVTVWSHGWSDGSLAATPPDGYPRYAARGGFATLSAHLAAGIAVRLSKPVVAVTSAGNRWQVATAGGERYQAAALLLTPPAPLATRLLAASGVALPERDRAALATIQFAPCLCGLFALDGATQLPDPGALQRPGQPISWIADNRRKGISGESCALTVHANRDASVARWNDDDRTVLAWLAEEARPWLAAGATVCAARLVRWPHAVPLAVWPERCLVSEGDAPLVFAGDAFGGPRVEGAALSGWAAAAALQAQL